MGHRSTSNSKDHHHRHHHHSSSSSSSRSRSRSPHPQPKDEDARHAILNEIEKEKKTQEEEERKRIEKIKQEYLKRRFNRADKREDRNFNKDSKSKEKGGDEKKEEEKPKEIVKPDFGLSGALASDARTGNIYKGFVLKWSEPPEARKPTKYWRLYVFKGDNKDPLQILHIHKQSAYLIGHQKEICDIYLEHPSISKQHAVIQFRLWQGQSTKTGLEGKKMVKPYIMDLKSANGTFLNGERIEPERYIEILEEDVLKFGGSSREYVLLSDKTGKE